MNELEKLKEKREILYSELMEILKPYSDKKVWFNCETRKDCAVVDFYLEGEFYITLTRHWGREEVEISIREVEQLP